MSTITLDRPVRGASLSDAATPVPPAVAPGSGAARPPWGPGLAAGLAVGASGGLVAGLFANVTGAALLALAAAVFGAAVATVAARSANPGGWHLGIVPLGLLAGAATAAPGTPDAFVQVGSLVRDALVDSGPGPIPLDGGIRLVLVAAFVGIGYGAGWVASGLTQVGASLLLATPVAAAAGLNLPPEGTDRPVLLAGTIALAACCVAQATRPDRPGPAGAGPRSVARSLAFGLAVAAAVAGISQFDVLFPTPRASDARAHSSPPPTDPSPPTSGPAPAAPTGAAGAGASLGEDVPVELFIPRRSPERVLAFQRARDVAGAAAAVATTALVVRTVWPAVARSVRRRRRRRWAAELGARGRVAVAYAAWRDVAIDAGVGARHLTPLGFCGAVVEDPEHEQLAWLATRAFYGDLADHLDDVDAQAAEDLARSLRQRLLAAQPIERRVLARLSRGGSLTHPYSNEVPGAPTWPRPSWPRRAPHRDAAGPAPVEGSGSPLVGAPA